MRRVMCSLAVVGIFVTLLAAPANAVKPDRFQPGPNPDLVIEDVCPFPVLLHDVVNTIVIQDFVDQDGNLVMSIGTGRILEEVSRLDAEGNPVETVTRNISGPGVERFDESGSTLTSLPGSRTGSFGSRRGSSFSGSRARARSRSSRSRGTRTCASCSAR